MIGCHDGTVFLHACTRFVDALWPGGRERVCVCCVCREARERERERDHFSKCLSARGRCLQYAITLQMFHLLFVTNDDRRSLRLRLLVDFISSNAAALPSFSQFRIILRC